MQDREIRLLGVRSDLASYVSGNVTTFTVAH